MSISKKLKRLLFERDITPTDLAKALDLPVPTVHRIVTGRTTRPHEKSIKLISTYFGIDPSELSNDDTSHLNNNKIVDIPLINWQNLSTNITNTNTKEKVAAVGLNSNAFAVIMPDHSMEPLIEKDSTLIFDPDSKPIDRSYVLVKIADLNVFIVRQLLIDIDNSYIKSLNNDLGTKSLRLLTKHDLIIARLVEIRRKL